MLSAEEVMSKDDMRRTSGCWEDRKAAGKHTLKVYKLLQVRKRWDKCSASGKDQMQQ